LAQPLRWVAVFVFLIFLATPVLRSGFGQIILWSLFGMLRPWSSARRPAAASLLGTEQPNEGAARATVVEPPGGWLPSFLIIGALLAGIGLVIYDVRPLVGAIYRRRPPNLPMSDPAFLDRIETARWWWPHDPRTHGLEAAYYRAKAQTGPLSRVEIQAVTLAYERMIRANPYDPRSHTVLAKWYEAVGDTKRAIDSLRRGLAYCPASFELQYFLAGLYRRSGNPDSAKREYQRAHQLRPLFKPVLLNLAFLELRSGNVPGTVHYLQLARQIPPPDRAIEEMLTQIERGRIQEILDQLGKDVDVERGTLLGKEER